MGNGHEHKKHEEAYGRGARDAKEAGFLGGIIHDFLDAATILCPKTSEYESYEKGYHDTMSGKRK